MRRTLFDYLVIGFLALFFFGIGLGLFLGAVAEPKTRAFLDLSPQGKNYGIILNDVSLYRYERIALEAQVTWKGYGLDVKVLPRIRLFYQWGVCGDLTTGAWSHWVSKRYERGFTWDVIKTHYTIWYLTLYNYDIDYWGYDRETEEAYFCDENHFVVTGGLRIKI